MHKSIVVQHNKDQVGSLLVLYELRALEDFFYTLIFVKFVMNTSFFYVLVLQIIHVNLTQGNLKLLEVGKKLDMTYSVKWEPTNVTFARRFEVYLDYPFFEHQVVQFQFSFFLTLKLQY